MRVMRETEDNTLYQSDDGWTLRREYGKTPSGNYLHGRWVLRNAAGMWIDFDHYRNDIAERHHLDLVNWQSEDRSG